MYLAACTHAQHSSAQRWWRLGSPRSSKEPIGRVANLLGALSHHRLACPELKRLHTGDTKSQG